MENRKRQLMVLICFLAVFVSGICMMKMDTLAATSQKSFWDVEDINPVSNPASENWLTTLIAKQIVGSPKPTPSQLTQEQFDSIETLVIKTVPGSGKTPWEAPKELANLRNLKEIEFQALTSESVFNNTPNEMFEIPSLKKLKITYYKGNFPAKLCLATQIEELELLNGSGTLGSSKQTVIPQEFGNLVNLRRLNIQETVSNLSFPASIGNLVNLQSIEISDGEGVIFPDEIGKLQQLEIFNTANVVMDEFPAGLTNCKNLKELSLYGRNYTEIPEQISDLANLERLELLFLPTGCRIPDSIGQLTKLKYLSTYSVYYNDLDKEVGITQLPESIGNCTELEELNLTGASITSLPKSITKLKKLTKLDLSQCLNLKSLPADIGELTGLTQLDLEVVLPNIGQISTLPDSIVNLTNLTELKAGQQQLKKLPEQIGKMIGLTAIYVEGNQLTRLPDSIGQLKNLGILQAQRNNLVEIPASIGNLCLGQLFLQGNQLTSLPEEISGLDGSSWMGQVAIDLSNNKFKTVPDISLFKKATVASLDLSNCEIEELGDWTQEDGRPGALNGFYANQRVGVSVNLSGNRILNIPESWEGKVVPSSTVLKGQTTKVTAQYNPSTKKAVLTNPLQYHGGKLPIDKYTISGGGKYDYNAYTFTWDNAKPGDMYTITFDAKSIYNSQGEKLSQYSGTLYVSVGEGIETGHTLKLTARNAKGEDITSQWPQSFKSSYKVFPDETIQFKLPGISGYTLAAPSGEFVQGTGSISAADGYIKISKITQNSEVVFHYAKGLHRIQVVPVEDGTTTDLTGLAEDPNYQFNYEVEENGSITIHAPQIKGYTIKGESQITLEGVTSDRIVKFTYTRNQVEEKVNISIWVKDRDGNDLSTLVDQSVTPLKREVAKGSNVRVEAPVISGYKIHGDTFQEYNPITQDVEVTFTYKKDLQVTIHVEDSDENDLSKLVNQETNPLVISVSKGDNVKVEAPVISGYKIDGDSFKEYNPITQDEEVTFIYKKDLQVKILVKDSDGNDLSKLVNQETNPLVISVSKGDNVKVEAPVISGYKIDGDSIKEFNPITQNEQVTFTYKKQLQVTILVKDSKGKDLSSLVNQEANPLVLPVLKGDNVRVEAPVITGYKLQGENFKEFRPITTNETVEFIYQEEIKPIEKVTVTIHVKDTAGKDLSKLVDQNVNPLTIQVEKGSDVTVEAPVIEGYKLQGHSQIGFYPIGKDESVEFIYKEEVKPAEKVTVTIQTLDTDGIDLNSLVNTEESPLIWEAEKGSNVKVEAPVIEGYIVQGESTKEFSPIQQNEHIVFTYAKEIKPVEKVNITIIPRDEQDNDLSSLVNQEESPLFMTVEKNSNVIVSAPVIEGYKIQGYSYQEFYPILQDETVIFTYKETVKPVEKVNISILLRDDTGKDLSSLIDQDIYPLVRTAEKGSNVRIEYPEIEGYEIQGESVKEFIPILQNEEITFNYHKKEKPVEKVSVTIHVMDEKGKDLSSLVDQSAEPLVVEAEKGSEVRIEAPAINGYEVIGEGVQMFYPIIRDEIVKFVYKEKEKPVEKVKVRILVKDENGRDLTALVDQSVSPLEIESVKGESVKICAPVIDGYYVYGSDHYEFSPITGDQTVTFCYKQKIIPAEKVKIYVKVFDDNDRDISSLVDQSVTKLVYEVNKGSSITINAPAIKGYEVISQSKIQLQNVRYDQSAVFYYRKVKEKPKNPKLVLKQDRIEIFVGDNLQLEQMVSLATDSSNQDLRSKLRYSVFPSYLIEGQVFCSPIKGEFRVAITLPHEAGNVTKYLYVKVKERPKPDYAKLTLKKSKATMKVGKKLNLRDLISVAQDSNGKNIKDKVTFSAKNKKMIKKNYFVASKTGTFNVTFKMPYQKGTLTKELKVVVKPASPVLRLKKTEITVKSGETVNMKQYIKEALQYKGGKNAIKLVKCRVGSENLSKNMKFTASKAGKYKVMYSLTNKYGITVKKSMNMIVKAKKQLPVLELSTDNLSITPGKRVYLKDFIKTASDDKDGPNLKSKVICTLNGERLLGDTFYSYNTGSFTILYRLTNQAGQTAMAQLEINVKPWRN